MSTGESVKEFVLSSQSVEPAPDWRTYMLPPAVHMAVNISLDDSGARVRDSLPSLTSAIAVADIR